MHDVVNPIIRQHASAVLEFRTAEGQHSVKVARPDRYASKNIGNIGGVWLFLNVSGSKPSALVNMAFNDAKGSGVFSRELVVKFNSHAEAERWLRHLNPPANVEIIRL